MIKMKDLLDKVRLVWISLISNIKSFFSGSHHKSSADEQYANSNNYGDSNIEETHGENTLESEKEEVWYDALEELEESELDEEEKVNFGFEVLVGITKVEEQEREIRKTCLRRISYNCRVNEHCIARIKYVKQDIILGFL